VLRLIQAVAPQMRTRNSGTIVNVSSVTGRVAFPLVGIYCSTKWAIEGLSESLRIELGHFGVRVIVVEPESVGTTARDAPRTYFGKDDPYLPLAAAQTTPPKDQLPTPEQIARTIADAIDANNDVFRWPAGEHAKRLLGMRQQLDDEAFYPQFRAATKLDW
jgi:NADP-dependent 3-hydroxy acid dehydrogenase YdfG